jgi:hypothetical protein
MLPLAALKQETVGMMSGAIAVGVFLIVILSGCCASLTVSVLLVGAAWLDTLLSGVMFTVTWALASLVLSALEIAVESAWPPVAVAVAFPPSPLSWPGGRLSGGRLSGGPPCAKAGTAKIKRQALQAARNFNLLE